MALGTIRRGFHTEYVIDDDIFKDLDIGGHADAFCMPKLWVFREKVELLYKDITHETGRWGDETLIWPEVRQRWYEGQGGPGHEEKHEWEERMMHRGERIDHWIEWKNFKLTRWWKLLKEIDADLKDDSELGKEPVCVYPSKMLKRDRGFISLIKAHEQFHALVGSRHWRDVALSLPMQAQLRREASKEAEAKAALWGDPGQQRLAYGNTRVTFSEQGAKLYVGTKNACGPAAPQWLMYVAAANKWAYNDAESLIEEGLARVAELEASYRLRNKKLLELDQYNLTAAVGATNQRMKRSMTSAIATPWTSVFPQPATQKMSHIPDTLFAMVLHRIQEKHGTMERFIKSL